MIDFMRFNNRVANLIQALCFEIFLNEYIIDTQCNVFLISSDLFFYIH